MTNLVRRAGFTLLEVLLSLSLLGVIMVSTFNFIDSTTTVASGNNSSNELVREGQIGQQVISARIKEACYLFPEPQNLVLTVAGWTSENFFTNSQIWTVNTDPFVAMILPPAPGSPATTYRFVAYYAIPRSEYIARATGANDPGADARNDANTWVIVQYKAEFTAATDTLCRDMPSAAGFDADIRGEVASLLLDYVDIPANRNELFRVGANFVDYDIRLEKTGAGGVVSRVGGPGSQSALNGRIYPENLGL